MNVLQILLHGMGVMSLAWMILDGWGYQLLAVIGVFFVAVPFLMEVSAICMARAKHQVYIQIQREEGMEKYRRIQE